MSICYVIKNLFVTERSSRKFRTGDNCTTTSVLKFLQRNSSQAVKELDNEFDD